MNKDILARYAYMDKMTPDERQKHVERKFTQFMAMMAKIKAEKVGVKTVTFSNN